MNKNSIRKIVIGLLLFLTINVVYEDNNIIPALAADTVVVNATNVNVRSQPNTKSKSYGKVSKGTTLLRTEERADGWSCVDYSGTSAYIKTDLLLPSAIAAGTAASGAATNVVPIENTKSNKAINGSTTNYIANKNTHKFHYPSCNSVSEMKEKNKWYFNGSRDELIGKGYVPCKRCKP